MLLAWLKISTVDLFATIGITTGGAGFLYVTPILNCLECASPKSLRSLPHLSRNKSSHPDNFIIILYQTQHQPAFLFPLSSAHVGHRCHRGCGPRPYRVHGILHLQEVHQQEQEAQKGP